MEVLIPLTILLFWLGFVFFIGLMWWKIMERTGYHGALGILMLVPIANIILMAILAFKEWPIQKDLKEDRKHKPASLSTPIIILIVAIAIFFILALLAAFAIPGLSRAKTHANETMARSTLKTIAMGIETYAMDHNGYYPDNEDVLYPYLQDSFNNKKIAGYLYKINSNRFGYAVTATPLRCNVTGRFDFRVTKGMDFSMERCRK